MIVGSGLTGGIIALLLHEKGLEVVIVERHNHYGENVFYHYHPCQIKIHAYGPYYFKTNSPELWNFVNRFSDFYPYETTLKSIVNEKFKNWSIAASYIKINAFRDSKLLISGTLGEYKYYDMDQLIDRAIYLANKIPGKTLC